jgi:hypothetical protein
MVVLVETMAEAAEAEAALLTLQFHLDLVVLVLKV